MAHIANSGKEVLSVHVEKLGIAIADQRIKYVRKIHQLAVGVVSVHVDVVQRVISMGAFIERVK